MGRLTLISGGKSDGPAEVPENSRRKAYREIYTTFRVSQEALVGPAFGNAVLAFAAVSIAFAAVLEAIERGLGYTLPAPAIWLGGVVASTVAIIAYRRCTFRSWKEKLLTQLAAYDPANSEAYSILQASVENNGLTRDTLVAWLYAEGSALGDTPYTVDRARDRFLKRRID